MQSFSNIVKMCNLHVLGKTLVNTSCSNKIISHLTAVGLQDSAIKLNCIFLSGKQAGRHDETARSYLIITSLCCVIELLFAYVQLRNLDPFLMLDEFRLSKPAGFPDHPHRGFETVSTFQLDSTFS